MGNLSAKMIELDNGVYVIPGNTNVGVICSKLEEVVEVYLVDSGATEIDSEYIFDIITDFFQQAGTKFYIKAILTTHAHADHCGGHNFLKEKTNCKILAAKHEQGSMETPMIQCTTLWGGYPPHELRTLYFKPEETYVDDFIGENTTITLSDNRLISFMELHGHSHCSLAIIITTAENKKIVFAGDNIFPKGEIGHYWIPLIINPVMFMESLDKLCSIKDILWCIPSHGDFLKRNIEETAELNKIAILSTRMCILESLKDGKTHTAEEIIKFVADKNNLKMSLTQYALISSTVKSYISIMHDAKEIKLKMENNTLYFYRDITI